MDKAFADKIIDCLKRGTLQQAKIAEELKVSRSTISKYLVWMEKQGMVKGVGTTLNRYYEVTEPSVSKSVSNILEVSSQPDATKSNSNITSSKPSLQPSLQDAQPTAEATQAYRNHADYIEYPLESYSKEELKKLCDDKGVDFKQWATRHNYPLFIFRSDGYELRLYNRCIVIVPPDKEVSQSETLPFEITQAVQRESFKIAREAETLYNLKIRLVGGFYVGALVRQELSQTNNPLSTDVLDRKRNGEISVKEKTFRIIDPDTDRKCFEFDDSPDDWLKSLKEAEATDPANADNHATEVHTMLDDVLHRQAWATLKEDRLLLHETAVMVGDVLKVAKANTDMQATFASNLQSHTKLVRRLNWMLPLAIAVVVVGVVVIVVVR